MWAEFLLKLEEIEDYDPYIIWISDNDPEVLKKEYMGLNNKNIIAFSGNKDYFELIDIINKLK